MRQVKKVQYHRDLWIPVHLKEMEVSKYLLSTGNLFSDVEFLLFRPIFINIFNILFFLFLAIPDEYSGPVLTILLTLFVSTGLSFKLFTILANQGEELLNCHWLKMMGQVCTSTTFCTFWFHILILNFTHFISCFRSLLLEWLFKRTTS